MKSDGSGNEDWKPKDGAVASAASTTLFSEKFQKCRLSRASLAVEYAMLQAFAVVVLSSREVIVLSPNRRRAKLANCTSELMAIGLSI